MASVEEFLVEKQALGQAKKTIAAYRFPFLKFRQPCAHNPTESDLYRFMAALRCEG
jgi:hypothetical protein